MAVKRKGFTLSKEALDAVAERVVRVRELCQLWIRVTGKSPDDLNTAINKKWSVTDGIDCLSFERIDHIRDSLLKLQEEKQGVNKFKMEN